MNESITKFCKICQIKVEKDGIFHLLNDCQLKLLPQIDLHLTPNSVICDHCFNQITNTQEFKQLQVKDEGIVNKLLQQDVPPNNKELDANFKHNTICVKEEPGLEKVEEEYNVGFIKDEVCYLEDIKQEFLVDIDNEKYYCHDCGCCTDTKQKLIEHIYKEHRKKDLKRKTTSGTVCQCDYKSSKLTHIEKLCTQCNYTCLRTRRFKTHTGKYPYQCDKCDYKSTRRSNLKAHIQSQHISEKLHQCDKCDYKCVYKANLKRHTLSHHTDKKPYQCVDKLSGKKLYQCDKCDYKSVQKKNLEYHTSHHTGEKPYQCDKCDYKCVQKSRMKNHILSQHIGEKPYMCDKCDYKCFQNSRLKYHTLFQHTSEKPYQCDKCNYKSAYKNCLKLHNFFHTGE